MNTKAEDDSKNAKSQAIADNVIVWLLFYKKYL